MKGKIIGVLGVLILSACAASAQEHELGFQIGAMGTEDRDVRLPIPGFVRTGNGLAYQVSYANRIYNAQVASLHVEFPITVTPKTDITSSNALSPRSYSSLFITPGLKLKFLPFAPASPYVVGGVGYARFNGSDTTVANTSNLRRTHGKSRRLRLRWRRGCKGVSVYQRARRGPRFRVGQSEAQFGTDRRPPA